MWTGQRPKVNCTHKRMIKTSQAVMAWEWTWMPLKPAFRGVFISWCAAEANKLLSRQSRRWGQRLLIFLRRYKWMWSHEPWRFCPKFPKIKGFFKSISQLPHQFDRASGRTEAALTHERPESELQRSDSMWCEWKCHPFITCSRCRTLLLAFWLGRKRGTTFQRCCSPSTGFLLVTGLIFKFCCLPLMDWHLLTEQKSSIFPLLSGCWGQPISCSWMWPKLSFKPGPMEPLQWSSVPLQVRSAPTLQFFKSVLKTHFFSLASLWQRTDLWTDCTVIDVIHCVFCVLLFSFYLLCSFHYVKCFGQPRLF